MHTAKIEVPKGHEIDKIDAAGNVTFRPLKDAILGIKTVDALLEHNGTTLEKFNAGCTGLATHERAFRILDLLARTLNEGWVPNWDDTTEAKYHPYFYLGSSGFRFYDGGAWYSASYVGSRLCFKTSDLARHAGEHFTAVYEEFMQLKQATKKGPVTDIKTVEDLLAYNGITQEEFAANCKGLTDDEVAYRTLKLLAETINEGWTPDWDDEDEYKYYPWFAMDGGSSGFRFGDDDSWDSASYVGSRLCFKTSELAQHAGKHFASVYEKFMVIK